MQSMSIRRLLTLLAVLALCVGALAVSPALAITITDDFNRPNGSDLGSAGGYPWVVKYGSAQILNGELHVPFLVTTGISLDGFTAKNQEITVRMRMGEDSRTVGHWSGFGYRCPNMAAEPNGQGGHLFHYLNHQYNPPVWGGVVYVWNNQGGHTLGVGNPDIDYTDYHTFKVRVEGNNHKVWQDDELIGEFNTAYYSLPGYFCFKSINASMYIDSITIEVLDVPGTLTGKVTEEGTTTPIEGATVTILDKSGVTDASGDYTISPVIDGTYPVSVKKDGYYPGVAEATIAAGTPTVVNLELRPAGAPSATVYDTFTRDDNWEDIGTTEDAGAYQWVKATPESTARVEYETLVFDQASATGASPSGFFPADVAITAKMTCGSIMYTGYGFIAYRSIKAGVEDSNGYSVRVNPDTNAMSLLSRGATLATASVSLDSDFFAFPGPTVVVKALGAHHQVWVDGTKYIDYVDTSDKANNGPGLVVFGQSQVSANFDDINIDGWNVAVTSTVTGIVTSGATPLEGAEISAVGVPVVTSNANGEYALAGVLPGSREIEASKPGYYAAKQTVTVPNGGTVAAAPFNLAPLPAGAIYDTFSRAEGEELGTTEDPGAYPWNRAFGVAGITAARKLFMPIGHHTSVVLTDKLLKDFEITYDGSQGGGSYGWGMAVLFRAPGTDGNKDLGGHLLHFWGTPGAQGFYIWNPQGGHTAGVGNIPIDLTQTQKIKLRVVGNRHSVWINDVLYWDNDDNFNRPHLGPWYPDAGYLSLVSFDHPSTFDNIVITEITDDDWVTVNSVSEAKAQADGTAISLADTYVVAKYAPGHNFFYVEDEDRTSGIKVLSSASVQVGQSVTIKGTLGTTDTERHIVASDVAIGTETKMIAPLGINGRDADTTQGLKAVGLLVTTWGEVKVVNEAAHHIAIQDGGSSPWVVIGYLDGITMPEVGDYVTVTGALGFPPGNTDEKIIWMRDPAELIIRNAP